MTIPNPNDDPIIIADWLESLQFPFDEDEKELLTLIKQSRYTQEYYYVDTLHSLRILYWQAVGWLRGVRNENRSDSGS